MTGIDRDPMPLTAFTAERIATAAERILAIMGRPNEPLPSDIARGEKPRTLCAEVSIDRSEFANIPDHALPIITVSKPLPTFKEAVFTYGVHYSLQSKESCGATLYKGDTPSGVVRRNNYPHEERESLSEQLAERLANDLERIAPPFSDES